MQLKCDFHIHSCLSPCGSLEMSPKNIVKTAVKKKLDVIALTDHNCALNTPAFERACKKNNIKAIFGIEATTSEEFHVLCLFETVNQALSFGEIIYDQLISSKNIPEKFGDQVYVDDQENILGEVEKYLPGGALAFSSDVLLKMVLKEGGLFIPAHIDRPAFSIGSQLGFLPPDPYHAVEITNYPPKLDTRSIPLISNSDAHYLEDIGKRHFILECENNSFTAIKKAIKAGSIKISI